MLNFSLKNFTNLLYKAGATFIRDALPGDEESSNSYDSDDSLSQHSSEDELPTRQRREARLNRREVQNLRTLQLNSAGGFMFGICGNDIEEAKESQLDARQRLKQKKQEARQVQKARKRI